ncbi:TonB-dependent siderophore receptor [Gloeocapsopsis sp. IPPAS B-1203]|uniref:TonB-dependent siderophore receptor n=1 Tax=Gloeocapsopsis sp. IPPAS B-1203 TaxID=2049454 RepID=UPI000C1A48FD|nr:TonB-dependent siderophore receptor [Gloeocapsopsis sp. IPPAS B-1203]PIG94171.1 TonB-dependent siderophore receptor [Gloeocapsopsis sp. IPPAS B-1203]
MQKFRVAFGRLNWQLWIVALVLIAPSPVRADTQTPQLSEIKLPANSTQLLVQTPTIPANIVLISGVRANPTDTGVEVILETTQGEQLQVINRSSGNNYIADIPNAQLRLPNNDAFAFRSENSTAGITEITVTNFDANTVRIAVIGEAALPTVELFDSNEGLIFGIVTATSSAQQPVTPSTEDDELIEILVTGEQDGYKVPNASVGTRTDTPLRDIPQSIQVVPQEVLQEQRATRLGDALRNVTGVNPTRGSGDRADSFTIRGFEIFSGNVLNNGLLDRTTTETRDLYNVARVEVLKGPASVLYGSGNPGGTVNIVTKQPLAIPFYEIEATVGSYSLYRGSLDFSGPLNDAKTVLYRLNLAYQNSGSYIDFVGNRSFFIAPAIKMTLGENTNLTFEGEYSNKIIDSRTVVVLPAVGTVLPGPGGRRIPRNRTVYEPEGDTIIETTRLGYRLEHRFSDTWSLRNDFRVTFEHNADNNQAFFLGLDSDNQTANRITYGSEGDSRIYNLTTDISGRFSTGFIEHQLLFGVNLSRFDNFNNFGIDLAELAPLDIYNPVYSQPIVGRIDTVYEDGSRLTDALGIYIQDQIKFTENFKLLLGGRFDLFTQTNQNFLDDTTDIQSGDAFTPRVGIVYQPIPAISLYASYSQSFNPIEGRSANGSLFQPERGTQYEVGVKADLNERLATTLSLYSLTRSNLLTTDPNDSRFSIQTGEQRSQGIEFDITGEISPGWNILAGYAYTDAKIIADNNFPSGNRLTNAPEHSFNLWTTYEIQSGDLRGLGFGLGLFYIGDRAGDLENSFDVPSYLRTDATIFYRRDRLRVALNVKNLFDTDYFVYVTNRDFVLRGDPLTISGTISWEF